MELNDVALNDKLITFYPRPRNGFKNMLFPRDKCNSHFIMILGELWYN